MNLYSKPLLDEPLLGFRFSVAFLSSGVVPNPIDVRFQSVSGLALTAETRDIAEGGENLHSHRLPVRLSHENLVMSRGIVVGSILTLELESTFARFSFNPGNVMVSVLEESGAPRVAWLFRRAYPVKWSVSDLNATKDDVVIDTMEFAYATMLPLRI